MRRIITLMAAGIIVVGISGSALCEGRVGLGASVGAVFPNNDKDIDWSDVGLNWGFWVDIPIAWVFNLTPSAEIYDLGGKVGKDTATDICLNFKFIVPFSFMRFFFGVAGGVTNHLDYHPNAGVLAGLSFPLVSNLEAFVQAKYKILIADPNVHTIHANAGMLFMF
ncbi:MAG: hypothetical protein GXP49_14795 [Deltaproteobacteria bacterium]|nr:hypothetical protein [Deltaproteobacteria bacterium]